MAVPSFFTVVTAMVYDSEHDELYVQETIYDDDLYWLNQAEADDYRDEGEDLSDEVDEDPFDDYDFEAAAERDDFDDRYGPDGPGVDDFDDNGWGID